MRRDRLLRMLVVITTTMVLPTLVFAYNASDEAQKEQILKQACRVQVPFIENRGQVESKEVRFYAKTFGGTIFVEQSGVLTYHLPASDKKGVVIKEILTQKGIKVKGLEPSPTRVNYFIGNDKSNWRTNIPTYGSISLGEISRGIELKLKAYGNNVEKLFTVSPGGDAQAMRIKMRGARGLKVTEGGDLEVLTEPGTIKFTKPIAYQEAGGKKDTVEVAYALYEGNVYGFNVGDYDRNRSLIIDPLLAGTFIGGSDSDLGYSIALDSGGNVYLTGQTLSSDYPTTPGAYDTSFNGGTADVFVSKLDSNLSPVVECELVPDATVIPQGGTLEFQGTVTNNTDQTICFLFATDVTKPDETRYPPSGYLIGPLNVCLDPYQSKSGYRSHAIPLGAQLGTYTYHGYVGNYGVGLYHKCQFEFEVISSP